MTVTHSYTHCRFGVATRDVTPPVGIYARSWGAATHDVAEGVHRPFAATAAVFAPLTEDEPTLALVAVDLGWFQHAPDERTLRAAILRRTGLEDAALLINMSHTHAGANVNSQLADKPGSELIQPYIEHLTEQIGAAIIEARAALAPAWVTYGTGRCALAANRDLWDAEAQRFATGYNPDAPADDTLVVARVTGEDGELRATLFNYACHPTTLAWANRQLSPDYIGAAREVLERAFGAPALFLQGASGELAPRDDYVGDTAVADRNGRQLGYAAAAAIESLPPPGPASSTRGSSRRAPTSAPGSTSRATPSRYAPASSWRRVWTTSSSGARRTSASSTASRLPTRCRSGRRRCAGASSARRSATVRSTRCRSGRGGSATRCWSPSRTSRTRCSRSSCGGALPARLCSCSA